MTDVIVIATRASQPLSGSRQGSGWERLVGGVRTGDSKGLKDRDGVRS